MRRFGPALAVAALVSTNATGETYATVQCMVHRDGSGSCQGAFVRHVYHWGCNYAVFNADPHLGPNFHACFLMKHSSEPTQAWCTPDAQTMEQWRRALKHQFNFRIEWDRAARCTSLVPLNEEQPVYR